MVSRRAFVKRILGVTLGTGVFGALGCEGGITGPPTAGEDGPGVTPRRLPWTPPAVGPRANVPVPPASLNVRDFGARGDGTADDAAAIQRAIDAAGAGVVYLPAGEYRLGSGLTAKPGLLLTGAGRSTRLVAHGDVPVLTVREVTGVTIRHLVLDGRQAGSAGGDLVVIHGASGSVIQDCWLMNARRSAIHVTWSSGISILFNHIEAPYAHGILARNSVVDLVISNNFIDAAGANATTGDLGKGIGVQGLTTACERITVSDNIVQRSRQIAIEFFGGRDGVGVRGGTITGNFVERLNPTGYQFGISLDHSREIVVRGNSVRGCGYGLEAAGATDCSFLENIVESSSSIGVSVSARAADIRIERNEIRRPGRFGIQVYQSTGVQVLSNRVEESAGRGIFVNQAGSDRSFVVSENTVTRCATSGIYIYRSDGRVSGNDARGNNTSHASGEANIYYNGSSVLDAGNLR